MKLKGAVIKAQGVTFAVILVKMSIVNSQEQSEKSVNSLMKYFPDMPIVLMAQDEKGNSKYMGRQDIIEFLANVHPSQIPWKEYTFN